MFHLIKSQSYLERLSGSNYIHNRVYGNSIYSYDFLTPNRLR